jgi:tetratricopeptide (TPR) repeat protein
VAILSRQRNPDALVQQAVLEFGRRNFAGAAKLGREALAGRAGDLRALEMIYRCAVAQGRLTEGIQELKQAAASAPGSPAVQMLLGEVLKSANDRSGARAAFEKAQQGDPSLLRAATALADMDVAENNFDSARRTLEPAAAQSDPVALMMLADIEYRAGNKQKALDGYRRVVALDSRNVTALNNLAFLLADFSHDADEALKYAQQAKELSPDAPGIDDTLGWTHYQKRNFAAAITYLERAARDRSSARTYYHLAMAYRGAGDEAKWAEALQRSLEIDPSLAEMRPGSPGRMEERFR